MAGPLLLPKLEAFQQWSRRSRAEWSRPARPRPTLAMKLPLSRTTAPKRRTMGVAARSHVLSKFSIELASQRHRVYLRGDLSPCIRPNETVKHTSVLPF